MSRPLPHFCTERACEEICSVLQNQNGPADA
jgi:hypothetical protein